MDSIRLSREQASLLVLLIERLPKGVAEAFEESRQKELFDLYETLHLFADKRDRLFIGFFPAGIVYADREIEEHGDYRRIGFLPYGTLVFEPHKSASGDLLAQARVHAMTIQARKGEKFQISSSGQYVVLGDPTGGEYMG